MLKSIIHTFFFRYRSNHYRCHPHNYFIPSEIFISTTTIKIEFILLVFPQSSLLVHPYIEQFPSTPKGTTLKPVTEILHPVEVMLLNINYIKSRLTNLKHIMVLVLSVWGNISSLQLDLGSCKSLCTGCFNISPIQCGIHSFPYR
jgi:hypothetical protein